MKRSTIIGENKDLICDNNNIKSTNRRPVCSCTRLIKWAVVFFVVVTVIGFYTSESVETHKQCSGSGTGADESCSSEDTKGQQHAEYTRRNNAEPRFGCQIVGEAIMNQNKDDNRGNPIGSLNEFVASWSWPAPEYHCAQEGPEHNPVHICDVNVKGLVLTGKATKKQNAKHSAARRMSQLLIGEGQKTSKVVPDNSVERLNQKVAEMKLKVVHLNIPEVTANKQHRSVLQLSGDDVIQCYADDTSSESAFAQAAENALQYLTIIY